MDYSLLIGVKKERFEVLLPGSGLDQVNILRFILFLFLIITFIFCT